MKDGLPSSKVNSIFQDNQDYMWFGTDQGISRFDGVHSESFSEADGLCDNAVNSFFQDSKNRVWILTSSSCLSYYLNGKIFRLDSQLAHPVSSSNSGFSFAKEHDGNLYFSGKGSEIIIVKMDFSDSKITTIDEPKNQQGKQSLTYKFIPVLKEKELSFVPIVTQWPITFPADSAFNKWIYQDPENNLYSLSPRGISKNSKLLISASDLPAIRAIDKFYLDQDENIYIISSIRDNPSIDKSLVNDLENANTLYIKTKNGYIQSTESQLNNSFSDVYVDKHLNKWFSSYSNGIYLLPYSQRAYTHYEKYRGESVTCLGMGPRGNVFIGSSGNTIQRFNRNSWEQEIQLGPSNISNYISKVQLDTLNNILWCGWEFGLLKLNYFIDYEDTGNLNSTDVSIIPVSQLYDLVQISDSLLLCATDLGVKKIDLTNGSELKSEFSSTSTALSITKDHDGVIWFDQGNSLYFSEKNIIKELSTNNLDIQHKISDIELCHDGSIAVATQGGGIYFIKNKKVVHNYRMSNGLPSNSINKIQISGNTHYAASNKGIVSYEWNNESTKNEVFIKAKNGLPSDIVNDVLLADSMLYLATPAGLVIFKTNFLAEIASAKSSPPNLEIKSFSSKDSIFNPAHEIKLSYSQSFFKIDYHALVYDQPNFVEYSYRFSSNDEWQITKSTSLEFPKFESGSYSFQLRAKHYNSNWSKPKIVNFQALPPWWNTWWARGIYLLLLIGIGFIIARIYAKRKYEKQLALIQKEQALLEERNRISADMHDDLGSELTKVVILSQIARTKLNLPKEKEQPILAIGDAASGIVKKMNEIIWALNPSNDTLESLIAYLQNYVNEYLEVRDLNGRVIMPDSIPDYSVKAVFRRNSFLIIKECLHNIHKHAQASRVDVEICISNELKISVIEDGVGFDIEKTRRFGNGLNNMEKRASSINGKVIQSSSLGNGSKLILTLPLDKNHDFVLDKN